MSSDDPKKYYPYPTEGIIYPEPPSAAGFGGRANPQQEDGRVQYEEQEQGLQSYRDGLRPQLGFKDSPKRYPAVAGQTSSDLGQGTFGVELEFLVVQCGKVKVVAGQLAIVDPHPNETRWNSTKLSALDFRFLRDRQLEGSDLSHYMPTNREITQLGITDWERRRLRYSRTKLTRVLRERGLVAIKWPDVNINEEEEELEYVPVNDFSESEASDDEREENFSNSSRLGDFRSNYEYDQRLDPEHNYASALGKWQEDYYDYHAANHLKPYRTRDTDIRDLTNNRCTIDGWPNPENLHNIQRLKAILEERLKVERNMEKQDREDERNGQVDPLHVPVPGLRPKYKAWTVTFDPSVDGNGMVKDRYWNADNSENPFDEYFWFGAEVVSPVLPAKDERSREAVRVACGALRDSLRCHKPMKVSTGLHVHLGNTKGWTLFQAKRFASFWALTEKTLLQLHREDRDDDAKWCAKMRQGSLLWRAFHAADPFERQICARIPQRHPEAKRKEFEAQMKANVPFDSISDEFMFYLWQFDSINALHEGLGQNDFCRPGVKWRIRGKNSSLDGDLLGLREPGTIEVRIMQGTLDADNINNWVIVLEHIVDAVRTFDDERFRVLLSQYQSDEKPDHLLQLLGVPDDIREYWRDPKRRDTDDEFWEYPDRDYVDWTDPFMVPGHKATHGSFWD